jgi:hypothetical protein
MNRLLLFYGRSLLLNNPKRRNMIPINNLTATKIKINMLKLNTYNVIYDYY